jgi:putative endopeptidase
MHRIDLRVYVARVCVVSLSALIGTISSAATDAISPAGPHFGSFGIDLSAQDRSVKPGNDFFRYADGHWLATEKIPADRTTWGAFAALRE